MTAKAHNRAAPAPDSRARLAALEESLAGANDGLLELTYWDQFPIQLTVSPLLAVTRTPDDEDSAAELATRRARQVFELLRENAHLKTLLLDGAVAADAALPTVSEPRTTADG